MVGIQHTRPARERAGYEYEGHLRGLHQPAEAGFVAVAEGFSPAEYIDIVNRGMYRHLLRRNESELTLAGRSHEDPHGDLRWAAQRPHGSPVIRTLGVALRKALRRCTSSVTYDRTSFERALAAVPPGYLYVVAPSHRSYFDFLLSCYLCFQHPELGLPIPKIAAAEEFAKIPLVTPILNRAGAFYVRRGVGKALPEVQRELAQIARDSQSLMFFIEGQRSRGRHVLPPKRGLLRALQGTGRPAAIFPIAISYERIPEESAFEPASRARCGAPVHVPPTQPWPRHFLPPRSTHASPAVPSET